MAWTRSSRRWAVEPRPSAHPRGIRPAAGSTLRRRTARSGRYPLHSPDDARVARASREVFPPGQSERETDVAGPLQDARDGLLREHRPLEIEAELGAGVPECGRPVRAR